MKLKPGSGKKPKSGTKSSPKSGSDLVRKGYSKIARQYSEQRDKYESRALLARFSKLLPRGSKVIDLGSGAGVPVAKYLIDNGYSVVGIDFADGMVKLAKKNVPQAGFMKIDMTRMRFGPDSFNGAVSFYALIHVPREKHAGIYKKLHRMIKPDGIMFLNACGTDPDGWVGIETDYFGVPMSWSFYGPEKTSKIIEDAGFEILWSKVLKIGGEKQFWVLARNLK